RSTIRRRRAGSRPRPAPSWKAPAASSRSFAGSRLTCPRKARCCPRPTTRSPGTGASERTRSMRRIFLVLFLAAAAISHAEVLESLEADEGRSLCEKGQWSQARATLEGYYRRNPQDSGVVFWLARSCEEMGD